MTATIRVRVTPHNHDDWAVHADPEDIKQPWVRFGWGWEYHEVMANWPEFELPIPIPGTADPDPRTGSVPRPHEGPARMPDHKA